MVTTGSKVGRYNWKGKTPRITGKAIGTADLQVSAGQQGGRDHSTHTEKTSIPERQAVNRKEKLCNFERRGE